MQPKYFGGLLKIFFIIKLLLGISIVAAPDHFVEGRNYLRISSFSKDFEHLNSTITNNRDPKLPNIMIFFNYGCNGCWLMQQKFNIWIKTVTTKVNVNHYPVVFKPQWEQLAKLYYVNQELKIYSDEQLFAKIFDAKIPLWLTEEMVKLYASKNISEAIFKGLFNSFEVARKVKNSVEISKIFNVNVTPCIVIKFSRNSYMVNMETCRGTEEIFKVLEYLIRANS